MVTFAPPPFVELNVTISHNPTITRNPFARANETPAW